MNYSSDCLAQVEQSLAVVAQSNTASTERLDRIEAVLAENARQLTETRQLVESNAAGLRETRAITESNARAIEAWGASIEEVRIETEGATRADLAVRIQDNAHNQDVDRVRFDALHEEHTRYFNTLLEEGRADRQRIDEALAKAERDRALNESEHRAFRETFQTMLAEIARLWHRETD